MSSLPELAESVHLLNPLADKYFALGIQLGIKIQQLRSIESNYPDVSRHLTETISLWQENNTGECSWSVLAEAVKRIGGHDGLVEQLMIEAHCDINEDFRVQQHQDGATCATATGNGDDMEYSSKRDSGSGDSSGSEAECFEMVPGCGCPKEKRCSLSTFYGDGCLNPTGKGDAIVKRRLKAITQNNIRLEEEQDFEDYEESTKNIQKAFGNFALETSRHFKTNKVKIEELILYIQGAYPVMKPRMEELSKATSLDDVFRIIVDQACSWFDCEIIKDLIHRFCVSAKSHLAEYYAHFKKYAEQRLPDRMKHIEISSGARRGGTQLIIKVDREWKEVTFNDLSKLRGTFASILSIRRKDLYLADIREGCIEMTFMITEELAGKLFPTKNSLTSLQVKFLKDEGVTQLKCGNEIWSNESQGEQDFKGNQQSTADSGAIGDDISDSEDDPNIESQSTRSSGYQSRQSCSLTSHHIPQHQRHDTEAPK